MRRNRKSSLLGDIIGYGLCVVMVIAIAAGVTWYNLFKWHECRGVGHSVLYCILTFNG